MRTSHNVLCLFVATLFSAIVLPLAYAETVDLRGYQVISRPVVSYGSVTTFSYDICNASGGADADTFIVEIPPCIPALDLFAVGLSPGATLLSPSPANLPASSYALEPKTSLRGVQVRPHLSTPGCKTISLNFAGNRAVASGRGIGIATAGGSAISQFPGPSCETGAPTSCGAETPGYILYLFDRSKSMNSVALLESEMAALELATLLVPRTIRPHIGIASFNITSQNDARMIEDFVSSSGYDYPFHTLRAAIEGLPSGSGMTDLASAITFGEEILRNVTVTSEKYLVIFSDGHPNRPNPDPDDRCIDTEGATWAADAATTARAHGIKIITIHAGATTSCDQTVGANYLKTKIASGPGYFSESWDDLTKLLPVFSKKLSCDDANSCTDDICIEPSFICRHNGRVNDSDRDNTPDCRDSCPGANDSLLNSPCSAGAGECLALGVYQCGNGALRCTAAPRTPGSESCNGKDDDCDGQVDEGISGGCPLACGTVRGCRGCVEIPLGPAKDSLTSSAEGLASQIQSALLLTDKESAEFEVSVRRLVEEQRVKIRSTVSSLPKGYARCRASSDCPVRSILEAQEQYALAFGELYSHLTTVLREARKNGADRAATRRLLRAARRNVVSARAILRRIPNAIPTCGVFN